MMEASAISSARPRFPSSKFSAPSSFPQSVSRHRLLAELDRGANHRLTLLVGSPGAGKTVLLADWAAGRLGFGTSWLSCDVADAEPRRFFLAVVEALRRGTGQAEIGEDAAELIADDGNVSADAVAALTDDIEGIAKRHALVIDDFHVTGAGGTEILATLLEYRPPSLQLVVSTRVDPQLRLHRMRVSGDLVELRDRDLSFSPDEAEALLSGFGVNLTDEELALLQHRTEGWAVGLQMAAISIRDSPLQARAPLRVELHAHTSAGYFLEEVLYRQRPEVADFMLAVSVLEDLSPAACSALCGEAAAPLLEQLWASHLFVALLDDRARVYRYHPLIKEVLRAELHARDPERERSLHQSAAAHLTKQGEIGAAARHLLEADDAPGATRLLAEGVVTELATKPTIGTPLDVDDLEPELFSDNPQLLALLTHHFLNQGAFDRAVRGLALAERLLAEETREPELMLIRGLYCFLIGQMEEALAHACAAREIATDGRADWAGGIDPQAHLSVTHVISMYGHAYLGDTALARDYADQVGSGPLGTPPLRDVLCPAVISQAVLADGALHEADALARRAVSAAGRLGFEHHYFVFPALRTTALLALERRDLATATEANERALSMRLTGRPMFDFLAQLDRARIWAAAGDLDGALSSLPSARAALKSDRSPLLVHADELESRLRLALGDLPGATRLAEALPVGRRAIVLAIIALRSGEPQEAAELLAQGDIGPGKIRSDLEMRLLRASVAIKRDRPDVPRLVREALAVINEHGYVDTVLDTAPDVVTHLIAESDRYPNNASTQALIAAGIEIRRQDAARPSNGQMPDPLTEAELRVLVKLSQQLTYTDIAADLNVSLNTVKTHLRHAYMKLGVTSRSTALRRALSLGLL